MGAPGNHWSRSVHGTPRAIARGGRDADRGIVQSHRELSDAFASDPRRLRQRCPAERLPLLARFRLLHGPAITDIAMPQTAYPSALSSRARTVRTVGGAIVSPLSRGGAL